MPSHPLDARAHRPATPEDAAIQSAARNCLIAIHSAMRRIDALAQSAHDAAAKYAAIAGQYADHPPSDADIMAITHADACADAYTGIASIAKSGAHEITHAEAAIIRIMGVYTPDGRAMRSPEMARGYMPMMDDDADDDEGY